MTYAELAGVSLHYRWDGPEDAPVMALSNSLGTDIQLWRKVMPALTTQFRVLRYDTRGHGQSSVPAGPYSIELLSKDVLSLLDLAGVERCIFCGLSIGGMAGIWLGINAPDRIERLILANTAARIGTEESWNERICRVHELGMESMAESIIERWFTPEFRMHCPHEVQATRAVLAATPAEGYVACCAAIRDAGMKSELRRIVAPTLVIAGASDPVIPLCASHMLHQQIGRSHYIELPASHISPIEKPEEFASAVLSFLQAVEQ